MKILYSLLITACMSLPMLRPARPARMQPSRSYSSRTTFQIKIANPKLIASLDAARQKATKHEQARRVDQTKKGADIAFQSSIRHNQSFAPQSSFSHAHAPRASTIAARSVGVAAVDLTEGYLEYKMYKKIDETFFENPAPLPLSPLAHDPDEDDDDLD